MTDAVHPIRRTHLRHIGGRGDVSRLSAGYGPFRYAGAAGWLLMASFFRVAAFNGVPIAIALANVFILLAVIDATQKTVEGLQGRTTLGDLSILDLLRLALLAARRVLPLGLIGLAAAAAIHAAGGNSFPFVAGVFLSIDGMAFDTDGVIASIFNATTCLLVFMVVVSHGTGGKTALADVLREIAARRHHLAPAFLVCVTILLTIGTLQDLVRIPTYRLVSEFGVDAPMGKFTFYFFVVAFAACRLSLLIFVLAFALRRSYARMR